MGTIVAIDRESKTIAGNYVIIGHPDAEGSIVSYTAYMHLGEIAPGLEAGSSRVAAGQVIGRTGDTGNAKGEPPHLHFEIRTQRRGGQLDPTQHLEIRRP
jgi:murein DD-endopeptidase MepM/ murein hydrolase activator NlpD